MENLKNNQKRSDNKVFYMVLITAVAVIVIAAIIFFAIPKNSQTNIEKAHQEAINSYKKSLYSSITCQYSCPLTNQTYQNQTQLLPQLSCVQTCTADFKKRQAEGMNYSDSDLLTDNLIKDIDGVVQVCRNESLVQTATLPTFNSSFYFPCVSTGLKQLAPKYPYLI